MGKINWFRWTVMVVTCCMSQPHYAVTQGARLLAVSSSGQSVMINLGFLDGIEVGERAKFFVPDNQNTNAGPNQKIKAKVLAIAEAIKVNESGSFWRFRRLAGQGSYQGPVTKNLKVRLMRMERDPRRPFVTRQTVQVSNRAQKQSVLEVRDSASVPQDLVFAREVVRQEVPLSQTKPTVAQDIEVTVNKSWVPLSKEYDEEFEDTFLNRSTPATGDVVLSERKKKQVGIEIWDRATTGVQKKYNDLKYGLNAIYRDSIDEDGFGINSDIDGHIFASEDQQSKLDKISVNNAIRRIKKNPYRWSQDLNDQELRQFVVESGIVQEVAKQKRALREKLSHELIFRYATPLQSSTVLEDQGNQGLGYSLAVAYEFALARLSDKWRSFSLDVELEGLISYHNIGGRNARFSETNGKLHLNWYFLRAPTSISRFMPFVSLGVKRGASSVESDELDYTAASMFSTRLGVKYRMSAGDGRRKKLAMGYGYQMMIGYDATTYTLNNTSTDSDLFTQFSSNQLKWSFGLSAYF